MNFAQILSVRGRDPVAGDPGHPQLWTLFLFFPTLSLALFPPNILYFALEPLGHAVYRADFGQVVVGLGLPVVDAIDFEHDAGMPLRISVEFRLMTRIRGVPVDPAALTNVTPGRIPLEYRVPFAFSVSAHSLAVRIGLEEGPNGLDQAPPGPVSAVAVPEIDQSGKVIRRPRQKPEAGVDPLGVVHPRFERILN